MNKIVLILAILLMSCGSENKSQETDLKGIDSLRYEMAKSYKEAQIETEREIETYRFEPCIPCDIDYLLRLEGKSEITKKDVENLLCIDVGCEDNAEFRQFYNEVLIESFNKNPDVFASEVYGLRGENYDKVLIELKNPVNEQITASGSNLKMYFINRIQ